LGTESNAFDSSGQRTLSTHPVYILALWTTHE